MLFVSSVSSKPCTLCCAFVGCLGVTMGLLLGVSNLVCELSDASDACDEDLELKKKYIFNLNCNCLLGLS